MNRTTDHLVGEFLGHHFAFHPVDATFMGAAGHDQRLPRADAGALSAERAGLAGLRARLAGVEPPRTSRERIELRFLESQIAVAEATLALRPPTLNPAWYSGEAAFAVIGLILPQAEPTPREAVLHRLRAIPDFLSDGTRRLANEPIPAGWRRRAQSECLAFARFLAGAMRAHPGWDADWLDPAGAAARAFTAFAADMDGHADREPGAGRDHLALLMRVGHGLDITPEVAEAEAEAAFARLGAELVEDALRLGTGRSWHQEIDALMAASAPQGEVAATYRHWHACAMAEAAHLVTPARDYSLAFRPVPPWFAGLSRELYFLSYRSPPPLRPGTGSVYWLPGSTVDEAAWRRAGNPATIKLVHAVHHGSIGHHTQNAHARAAPSRLARLAGVDCASALAFFPAGTMVEGWSSYAMDLMCECPGFYSPAERLLLKQHERRDAAGVLVDIRLHTGRWSPAEAARFYREAGLAPDRVDAEIVRITIYPGSRLIYRIGAEMIHSLRRQWRGDARAFHDRLLAHGSIPIAWAADEICAADRQAPCADATAAEA